jgi:magnesium transporter
MAEHMGAFKPGYRSSRRFSYNPHQLAVRRNRGLKKWCSQSPRFPEGGAIVPASLPAPRLTDAVSAHLRRDFPRLRQTQTVGEALAWIRQHPPQDRIIYFYVVDEHDRLCGVVPTRRLILEPPETPLADIMMRQVITLPATATVLDACEFFIQHRLLAFPVVDHDGRLVGVVDVDLYTDELHDLSDEQERGNLFQQIGVSMGRDWQGSPVAAFRRRFPWLTCNMGAGILAAFLSGIYKHELNRVVELAFFIPVVLNLAESVSSQSVSLALQTYSGRRPTWRSLLQSLRGELVTGVLLGAGAGAVIAATALVWLGRGRLALCLLGGVTIGVGTSAAVGLALPALLRLLRLEPRVAAGPIALATADIVTILAYFNLARWLLG